MKLENSYSACAFAAAIALRNRTPNANPNEAIVHEMELMENEILIAHNHTRRSRTSINIIRWLLKFALSFVFLRVFCGSPKIAQHYD